MSTSRGLCLHVQHLRFPMVDGLQSGYSYSLLRIYQLFFPNKSPEDKLEVVLVAMAETARFHSTSYILLLFEYGNIRTDVDLTIEIK